MRGAHAPRVLAIAPSRSRTFSWIEEISAKAQISTRGRVRSPEKIPSMRTFSSVVRRPSSWHLQKKEARSCFSLTNSDGINGSDRGSARVSRVGFGVSPKQSFWKVRDGETPSPTRETRALPRITSFPADQDLEAGSVCLRPASGNQDTPLARVPGRNEFRPQSSATADKNRAW